MLATSDLDRPIVHRQLELLPGCPEHEPVGAHDLRVAAEDADLRGSLADLEWRSARDPLHAGLERAVDARVELVADDDVDDARGSDDCERDRRRSDKSQPRAELTRAPRRRRLPGGEAALRRRLTPLRARCSPGPYREYCALRPRTPSTRDAGAWAAASIRTQRPTHGSRSA